MIQRRRHQDWPRIEDVLVLEGYRLRLWFDNGRVGDVDLADLVGSGPVFEPFADRSFFARVTVDPESGTICWPGEVDLDPDVLYEEAVDVHPAPPRPNPPATPDPTAPGEDALPELSRFLGIVISMYFKDHARPHFHVRYSGRTASVDIESLGVIVGDVPPRPMALAIEWAMLHRDELRENWERARRRQTLKKIAPLE